MLRVTAQGIEELRNILERMNTYQECGHGHGADMHDHSECGGCGVHAPGECAVEEIALRLVIMADGGFGLILDIPRNGDQIIERDGVKLLLIGHELVESVRGLVLDCVDTPAGRTLTFTSGQA